MKRYTPKQRTEAGKITKEYILLIRNDQPLKFNYKQETNKEGNTYLVILNKEGNDIGGLSAGTVGWKGQIHLEQKYFIRGSSGNLRMFKAY